MDIEKYREAVRQLILEYTQYQSFTVKLALNVPGTLTIYLYPKTISKEAIVHQVNE